MYLKVGKSNGKTHLSFVQGYRDKGKVKQKTIKTLGFLDELKKEYDDPIAHFRQLAKELTESGSVQKSIEVSLLTKLSDTTSNRKNLGYAIPKKIYSTLQLREFFAQKQRGLPIEFNLNSIFSLLVFNRFMFPASKKGAFERKEIFFEACDFSLDDVYRSLDYFAKYSNEIQQHVYQSVSSICPSDNELAYYDVTNYYFEIPNEDEDKFDENGVLIEKGMRKRGPSKEHRPDPIIQMGLLMNAKGIPIAFNCFSGGKSEKLSLRPVLKRVKNDFSLKRIVVVADRGLNTSDNTAFLSGKNHDDMKGNDGYLYGQSIMAADNEFKEWVLNQMDYQIKPEKDKEGNTVYFKHKSRIVAKKVHLKNSLGERNKNFEIYQKQMVYYSEKYAKKQKCERDKLIMKAKDLIANPGKYNRQTSIGAAGYVQNLSFSKETGEIVSGTNLNLNEEKIKSEELFDGYYSIVTSEKHLTDIKMRELYKGLWEIEESFKILKSEFKSRPIFVYKESHMEAHFLICFIALVILRLLEQYLQGKHTVKQIRKSLISYSCSYLEQNYYLFDYRDEVLKDCETIFGLDLSNKILSLAQIKKVLQYKN